jgi:hypothetical protein
MKEMKEKMESGAESKKKKEEELMKAKEKAKADKYKEEASKK